MTNCYFNTNYKVFIIPDKATEQVDLNGMAQLTCQTNGNPSLIQWYTPSNELIRMNRTISSKYTLIRNERSLILILQNITEKMNGLYRCQVVFNSIRIKKEIFVEVEEPIRFFNTPYRQYLLLGQSGTITCEAKGQPSPQIMWQRPSDNKVIMQYEITSHYQLRENGLFIKNVRWNDGGLYKCLAKINNKANILQRYIEVIISTKPKFISLPANVAATKGKTAVLSCEADGRPKVVIDWFKDGIKLSPTSNKYELAPNGYLRVNYLSESDDGVYICQAENLFGVIRNERRLTVHRPPEILPFDNQTIREGQLGRLKCIVRGEPPPIVEWRIWPFSRENFIETAPKSRFSFYVEKESIHVLQVKDAHRRDNQNYTCIAYNTAGRVERTGRITVQYQPFFDPLLKKDHYTYFVHDIDRDTTLGQAVKLECQVFGEPIPQITWFRGEEEIRIYSSEPAFRRYDDVPGRSILEIAPNSEVYMGSYTCQAQNVIQTNRFDFRVLKAEPPGVPGCRILEIEPTSLLIEIEPPTNDGGLPIRAYRVEYKTSSSPSWENPVSTDFPIKLHPDDVQFNVKRIKLEYLTAETFYILRVTAVNSVGYGFYSREKQFRTKKLRAPNAPYILSQQRSPYSNEYVIRWKMISNGGSILLPYFIRYRRIFFQTSLQSIISHKGRWKEISDIPSESTTFRLTNLQSNSVFEMELYATNIEGRSPASKLKFYTSKGTPYSPLMSEKDLSKSLGYSSTGNFIRHSILVHLLFHVIRFLLFN